MTLAALNRAIIPALSPSLSEAIYKWTLRLDDYRQYRRTVARLADLPDEQLADMGIARCSIGAVAREAVYGSAA